MRLLGATVLLLASRTAAARAQDAKPVWPPCSTRVAVQQAFDQASLILAGMVVQSYDYQERLISGTSRTSWRMHLVVLKVLRGWKGQPRDTVTFTTPPQRSEATTAPVLAAGTSEAQLTVAFDGIELITGAVWSLTTIVWVAVV